MKGLGTQADQTWIYNPTPDFTWGLNIYLQYKDWDLSMFWQGVQGVDVNCYDYKTQSDFWSNSYSEVNLPYMNKGTRVLATADQNNTTIQERTAEMLFLRAYGHFQLKRLFKKIPFVNKPGLQKVVDYTNLTIYRQAGFDMEADLHNNFRPEELYENGVESANTTNYEVGSTQTVDPRLFITVGMPGTQFMFNADVLLMRAEALAQLGQTKEAIQLVNQVRNRAKSMQSSSIVANYTSKLNVRYNVKPYDGTYDKDAAIKIIKMERRLELAMESERFFDLVRWGDAATFNTKNDVVVPLSCSPWVSTLPQH